jgi:endo-1,4-beta-xylanase
MNKILSSLIFLFIFLSTYSQHNQLPGKGKIITGNQSYTKNPIVKLLAKTTSVEIFPHNSPENSETLLIAIPEKTSATADIRVSLAINEDISKGDVLAWDFYFRSPWSENESGDGKISVNLQNPNLIEPGDLALTVTAGEKWKHIVQPFRAQTDMKKEDTRILINLGFGVQGIELSAIRLINYGKEVDESLLPHLKSTYEGRSLDADWRKAAQSRIEKYRKSDLKVIVKDKYGKLLEGAEVEVKMKKHHFGFGTATEYSYLLEDSPELQKYREYFLKYFNKTATERGLRWENWYTRSAEEQEKLRSDMDSMFAWFTSHDIPVRGHHLNWAKISERKQPDHLRDNPELLRKEYFEFQDWLANWVGYRVTEWDAINHIAGDMVGPGKTYADLYGMQIWADMIIRARETVPGIEMWVNEGAILPRGNRIQKYLEIIDFLIENGATPDGIGFMGHFRESSLTPPEEVYERLELFASRGTKLQLTELDVEVGDDEKLQADYFRDILTIAFSHPAMTGIVLWGFWEGRHWRPDAALWRKDWSIKPAGQVWLDLVYGEWWSDENGTTGPQGSFITKVFHGEHEILIKYKRETIKKIVDVTEDMNMVISLIK